MDSILSLIIPALIGGFFTYLIAVHRNNSKKASMMAEIQNNAIKTVQLIEERIRADLRKELDEIKIENNRLHKEVAELRGMLTISDDLIGVLKDEISALRGTLALYKDDMVKNKQRLSSLENGNGNPTL